MSLIKRGIKGSKLTIQEMDNNLKYLNTLGVVNISQDDTNIIFENGENGEITINKELRPDKKTYINKFSVSETKTIYKGILYSEDSKIKLCYNIDYENQLPIEIDYNKRYSLNVNLGYWIDNIYNTTKFNILFKEVDDYQNKMDIGEGPSPSIIFSFNNSYIKNILLQSDEKIILTGNHLYYNKISSKYITRLNTNGSIDTIYNSQSGSITASNIQQDDKVLIGAGSSQPILYNGVTASLLRLNTDGTIDTSFLYNKINAPISINSYISDIAIQSDGKIIAGGWISSYGGNEVKSIFRLNSDGSLDNTFNVGSGIPLGQTQINIKIQSDGKILVGGSFTSYNGVSANRIIRLNPDGSRDTSFNIGTGFNNRVSIMAIQSDGKILVGGSFTSYNGVSVNSNITRLNSDGSIDTSFNIVTNIAYSIKTIAIQSDGKILLGFETGGGIYNSILRLNPDGSKDTSFNIGTGFNNTVYSIVVQSDGKILVGGSFTTYNEVSINKIIRLNPDGSSDTITNRLTFNTNYVAKSDNNLITNLIIENDEIKIELNGVLQKCILDYTLIEY